MTICLEERLELEEWEFQIGTRTLGEGRSEQKRVVSAWGPGEWGWGPGTGEPSLSGEQQTTDWSEDRV